MSQDIDKTGAKYIVYRHVHYGSEGRYDEHFYRASAIGKWVSDSRMASPFNTYEEAMALIDSLDNAIGCYVQSA